jgi:predicted methyltransferase
VIEVGAGAGWYTEILAPLLTRQGKLIVASFDPDGPTTSMTTVYGKRLKRFLARSPELYGAVEVALIAPPDRLELAPPGSADVALAIREMHNWQRRGQMDAYLAAIHRALKDGGTFGVVQHRAPAEAVAEESAEKGYLPEKWLIARVEAAGFKLEESSEVNANPKDAKDYEKGVWTLPPVLREEDKDRDRYIAIGESDRMTLKFAKVAKNVP